MLFIALVLIVDYYFIIESDAPAGAIDRQMMNSALRESHSTKQHHIKGTTSKRAQPGRKEEIAEDRRTRSIC